MFVCTKENAKSKNLQVTGFEPNTSSIMSTRLNCYASSLVLIQDIVIIYIYIYIYMLLYLEVGDEPPALDQPPHPPPP
jgi:hypothetical protein